MPDDGRTFTFEAVSSTARRADGLVWGVRLYHPKFCNLLFWLNRDDDSLHELRPYKVGMFARREGGNHAE